MYKGPKIFNYYNAIYKYLIIALLNDCGKGTVLCSIIMGSSTGCTENGKDNF